MWGFCVYGSGGLMPKIFIDTNVFLDFYRAKQDKLEILMELHQHSDSIVFPSLVYDEFLRNRTKVIRQVITNLNNERPKYFNSAIVEGLEVFEDLKRSREEHKKYLDITISKMEEIKEDSKQDDVFLELSKLYKSEKIKIYEHDNSTIHKAQTRHLLGQPPGTDKIKICDEVIWETILAKIDDDIIIVSRDGTYQENYHYLSHEYEKRTDKKLLKVTDKINEGLKLLGVEVPQKIVELEEQQIEDIKWEVKESVETVLATLAPIEEKVLRMRYGLDDSGNEDSYKKFLRSIFYKPEHGINDDLDR